MSEKDFTVEILEEIKDKCEYIREKMAVDIAIKKFQKDTTRWVFWKINGNYPMCEKCRAVFDYGAYSECFVEEAKFCPNCGTKLEGGEDD